MTAEAQRVVALVAAAFALAWTWAFDPHRSGQPFVPCPFRAVTGWSCPACGSTRLAHDLLHGDVGRAWDDNALVLLLSPLVLVLVARWFLLGWQGRDPRLPRPRATAVVALTVAAGWVVVRNAV